MADKEKGQDNKGLFRQEALERLSSPERLDELMNLVTFKSWLPLGTLGVFLGLGLLWSLFGRVPVTTSGRGVFVQQSPESPTLVALLFFENSYRGQIFQGMPVVLVPETLQVSSDRGVTAAVKEVVEPPALTLDAARGSNDLADTMAPVPETMAEPSASDPLQVVAQLSQEAASMPPDSIAPGVAVEGRLTLEERAPITFVFPFLNQSSM